MSGANAAVVDAFGFVIELELDSIDFETLDEGLFGRCGGRCGRVIFELKEAGDEVQGILINVQAQRKNRDLGSVSLE